MPSHPVLYERGQEKGSMGFLGGLPSRETWGKKLAIPQPLLLSRHRLKDRCL